MDLWGIEPARKRDREPVPFPPVAGPGLTPASSTPEGRKGLVDGVGREDWDRKGCCRFASLREFTGENLEGTVPALALRPELPTGPLEVGTRSGKPS